MQAVKRKLVMAERGTQKDTVAGVILQEGIAEVFVHISANFIILSIQYIHIIETCSQVRPVFLKSTREGIFAKNPQKHP